MEIYCQKWGFQCNLFALVWNALSLAIKFWPTLGMKPPTFSFRSLFKSQESELACRHHGTFGGLTRWCRRTKISRYLGGGVRQQLNNLMPGDAQIFQLLVKPPTVTGHFMWVKENVQMLPDQGGWHLNIEHRLTSHSPTSLYPPPVTRRAMLGDRNSTINVTTPSWVLSKSEL